MSINPNSQAQLSEKNERLDKKNTLEASVWM